MQDETGPQMPGVLFNSWRLMAIDGTRFDVAYSAANAAEFGRPGSGRGEGKGGYPQAHVVALVGRRPATRCRRAGA
ncbi:MULTISPECIES: hypothetical protein [unclassified Streptomyces]|uniref:hypothetical protein n=1 Tax=unclassified Streptomyces TaxID=2593676 RepID=UPI0038690EBE